MRIADQVILQVFLLLGLSGQLKIYVIGEFREVAEAFLSTANAIPRETWRSKQIVNISNLPPNSSSGNNTVHETLTSHVLCHQPENCRGQRSPVGFHWPRGQRAKVPSQLPLAQRSRGTYLRRKKDQEDPGDGDGLREAQKMELAQGHIKSLHGERRSFQDKGRPIGLPALTTGLR